MFQGFKKQRLTYLLILLLFAGLITLGQPKSALAAPVAPTNLTATAVSGDQINLAWQDNSTDEDNFRVEMDGGYGFSQIGTTGANVAVYQATGLSEAKSYSFRVRAYGNYAYSPYSNTASKTTLLKTPTNLTTTAKSNTQIDLSWHDNTTSESNYVVERKEGAAGSWGVIDTLAAQLGGNSTMIYSNTGLPNEGNHTYFYRVKAVQTSPANNSAYSNEATATTQALTILPEPNLVGYFSDLGSVGDIALSPDGNKAYLASDPFGLVILDVSNRAQPKLYGPLSSQHPYGKATGLAVSGNLAIMTGTPRGTDLVDISNPNYPKVVSSVAGPSSDVAISGNYAYITGGGDLKVVNIANPYEPELKTTVVTPGTAGGVAISGNLAVVGDGANGLAIIDIFHPDTAYIMFSLDTLGGYAGGVSTTTINNELYALVANGGLGRLQIVKLATPTNPLLSGEISIGSAVSVAAESNFAYVSTGNNNRGLVIVNISTPTAPEKKGAYSSLNPNFSPNSAIVVNGIAYIASSAFGVLVVDATIPAAPNLLGSVKQQTKSNKIAVSGNTAIVTGTPRGTDIIDVSNPAFPNVLASVPSTLEFSVSYGAAFSADGKTAYIVDSGDVKIINVSTPSAPVVRGTVITPGNAAGVAVISAQYLAVNDSFSGLAIVNVTNPDAPFIAKQVPLDGYATTVDIAKIGAATYALVASNSGNLQRIEIDLSTPSNTKLKDSFSIMGPNIVRVNNNFAYVLTNYGEIAIIDISNPSPNTMTQKTIYTIPFSGLTSIDFLGRYAFMSGLITSTIYGLTVLDLVDPANPQLGPDSIISKTGTIDHPNQIIVANNYIYTSDMKSEINIFKLYKDLELTKFASTNSVKSGDTFTYTLNIKNPSAYAQKNLIVTDAIPAGSSYVTGSATLNGQYAGGTLTWTIPTIDPGATLAATFQVKVN